MESNLEQREYDSEIITESDEEGAGCCCCGGSKDTESQDMLTGDINMSLTALSKKYSNENDVTEEKPDEGAFGGSEVGSEAARIANGTGLFGWCCCNNSGAPENEESKEESVEEMVGSPTKATDEADPPEPCCWMCCGCCGCGKKKSEDDDELSVEEACPSKASATAASPQEPLTPVVATQPVTSVEEVAQPAAEAQERANDSYAAFISQGSGLDEALKAANYKERFPEASQATIDRWSNTTGCYLTFDAQANKFALIWASKPISKSVGFFSCPPEKLPAHKVRLGERVILKQAGTVASLARFAWLTFVKTAARYDGEFVFLTSTIWNTGGFGTVEIVVLQEDNTLQILKQGDRPYRIKNPIAIAAVENSFRFQSRRQDTGQVSKWSKASFSTTAKTLNHSLYTEIERRTVN